MLISWIFYISDKCFQSLYPSDTKLDVELQPLKTINTILRNGVYYDAEYFLCLQVFFCEMRIREKRNVALYHSSDSYQCLFCTGPLVIIWSIILLFRLSDQVAGSDIFGTTVLMSSRICFCKDGVILGSICNYSTTCLLTLGNFGINVFNSHLRERLHYWCICL